MSSENLPNAIPIECCVILQAAAVLRSYHVFQNFLKKARDVSKAKVWVGCRLKCVANLSASLPFTYAGPYPYNQKRQIGYLQKHLKAIPRPVILAGDFNATPWSHALSQITQATDTHVVGGLRLTYHLDLKRWRRFKYIPLDFRIGLPIDHVLTSPKLNVHTILKEKFVGSDHFPIVAKMIFR